MGTIKLEIDLPEFEKEFNINVTICRDGEVYCTTSSPTASSDSGSDMRKIKENNDNTGIIEGRKTKSSSPSIEMIDRSSKKSYGGNMMNLSEI